MKEKKDIKLKPIVVMIAVTFLSLVFAVSSFAWLSWQRDVGTYGMGVTVDPASGVVLDDVVILKREGSDKATNVAELSKVAISEYDAVFTDRNVNTPIIIKAKISNLPKDENGNYIKFSFVLYWYHLGDWFTEVNGEKKFTHYLSNVIGVRCGLGDGTINAVTGDENVYSSAIEYLRENTEEQTFVNVSKTGQTYELIDKAETLQFKFETTDYVSKISDDSLTLYVELNYSEILLEAYEFLNGIEIGDGDNENSDVVVFEGDLSPFIFRDGV